MNVLLLIAAVCGLGFGGMAILQAVALQKQVEELIEERDLWHERCHMQMLRNMRLARKLTAALPTPKWPGDAA